MLWGLFRDCTPRFVVVFAVAVVVVVAVVAVVVVFAVAVVVWVYFGYISGMCFENCA